MRFSSIVALVVVAASFALGGCAADAEPGSSSQDDNVVHEGTLDNDGRASEVRLIAKYGDEVSNHPITDGAHLRAAPLHEDKAVNPFVAPPSLGHGGSRVPSEVMSPEDMEAVVDQHTNGSPKP